MNSARIIASTLLCFSACAWLQTAGAVQAQSLAGLKQQATTGNVKAEVALGQRLMGSTNPDDKAAAVTWFRKAASHGSADAEWRLGWAYVFGQGVPKDVSTGLASLHKSLITKHPAKRMLGFGWLKVLWGRSIQSKQDVHEGMEWVQRAADAGSTQAMQVLGGSLLFGAFGVAQDKVAGERWLLKSAKLGNANAQAVLGKAYVYGLYVHADVKQGLYWLREGAMGGNTSAAGMLGYLLVTGDKRVPKNASAGVRWAAKAASKGDARAYYTLGLAYQHGTGEPADPAKAWYNFAAARHLTTNESSQQHANQHMSEVAGKLSAAQMNQLRASVAKIPMPANHQ